MPTYVCLMNLTEKGVADIKNAPETIGKGVELLEKMGGKLLSFYLVMGTYDYVGIAEIPSDEVAATFLLALGSNGLVRTTTLKAFPVDQVAKLIQNIPE
jgi:uncharacterized protein with GYD domain